MEVSWDWYSVCVWDCECECVCMCATCSLVLLLLSSVEFLRDWPLVTMFFFFTDTLTKYQKMVTWWRRKWKNQPSRPDCHGWNAYLVIISCVLLTMHTSYLTIYSIVWITGWKEVMPHGAQSLMQVDISGSYHQHCYCFNIIFVFIVMVVKIAVDLSDTLTGAHFLEFLF